MDKARPLNDRFSHRSEAAAAAVAAVEAAEPMARQGEGVSLEPLAATARRKERPENARCLYFEWTKSCTTQETLE